MRRIYNLPIRQAFSGFGSVSGPRALFLFLALAAPLGGCATVSVYEPSTDAEISLTKEQSALHKAAVAYCDKTREKGLAAGETSLGSLANILTGKSDDKDAYRRRIGADRSAPASVVSRVRADMNDAAKGLTDLNTLGRSLIGKTRPNKEDVSQFERALIHARQARDSFSDALTEVNKRSTREYQIALELTPLDEALTSARATADELASVRTDEANS
jgi:hypothetical protein